MVESEPGNVCTVLVWYLQVLEKETVVGYTVNL